MGVCSIKQICGHTLSFGRFTYVSCLDFHTHKQQSSTRAKYQWTPVNKRQHVRDETFYYERTYISQAKYNRISQLFGRGEIMGNPRLRVRLSAVIVAELWVATVLATLMALTSPSSASFVMPILTLIAAITCTQSWRATRYDAGLVVPGILRT